MKKIVLIAVMACMLCVIIPRNPAVYRWFSPDSRLQFFESRIAGVSREFMRRSPELRANFERFKHCMKQGVCNPASILEQRDKIISQQWPVVFDRLMIFDDWGENTDSRIARRRFFLAFVKHGVALRKRCVPRIQYKNRNDEEPVYHFAGFRCRF